MKRGLNITTVIIFFSLSISCLFAQSDTLVSAESSIQFKIRNAGLNVDGRFAKIKGEINLDEKTLSNSKANASVDVSTITTGIGARDRHLQGREYFDAKKFPTIVMRSKLFKQVSKNKFVGIFELTIRDITKEVEIPFSYSTKGKRRTFKGKFRINRLDYQVGEKSIILSDDVDVELAVVTLRAPN